MKGGAENLKYSRKRMAKKVYMKTADYVVGALLLVIFLFPFYVMFTRSLMTDEEVMFLPVKFFPERMYFGAYTRSIDRKFLQYTLNTLIVLLCNIIGVPLSASLCAYGFSKMKFAGRNACFAIVLSTDMLPAVAVQIPLYVVYNKIGFLNTLLPFTVPAFFGGGATTIFLMRQFMKGIPDDICASATIDGAGEFRIYLQMVVPLCMPIMLFTMFNAFIGVWNDFMGPLMYLNDHRHYTLAVGIYHKFLDDMSRQNLLNVQMATSVILLVPCLALFALFQKQLIDGVTLTGIKA